MDAGFYMAAGTLPKTQYFCYLNIEESWPVILEEQDRLIEEKAFDYIIAYDNTYEWEGYEIVDETNFTYTAISGKKVITHFCLYKKTV